MMQSWRAAPDCWWIWIFFPSGISFFFFLFNCLINQMSLGSMTIIYHRSWEKNMCVHLCVHICLHEVVLIRISMAMLSYQDLCQSEFIQLRLHIMKKLITCTLKICITYVVQTKLMHDFIIRNMSVMSECSR